MKPECSQTWRRTDLSNPICKYAYSTATNFIQNAIGKFAAALKVDASGGLFGSLGTIWKFAADRTRTNDCRGAHPGPPAMGSHRPRHRQSHPLHQHWTGIYHRPRRGINDGPHQRLDIEDGSPQPERAMSRGMPCASSASSCGCNSCHRVLHRAYPIRMSAVCLSARTMTGGGVPGRHGCPGTRSTGVGTRRYFASREPLMSRQCLDRFSLRRQ